MEKNLMKMKGHTYQVCELIREDNDFHIIKCKRTEGKYEGSFVTFAIPKRIQDGTIEKRDPETKKKIEIPVWVELETPKFIKNLLSLENTEELKF